MGLPVRLFGAGSRAGDEGQQEAQRHGQVGATDLPEGPQALAAIESDGRREKHQRQPRLGSQPPRGRGTQPIWPTSVTIRLSARNSRNRPMPAARARRRFFSPLRRAVRLGTDMMTFL